MPGGDGTGPMGSGRGKGAGRGRRGGAGAGIGVGGECVCVECGTTKPHEVGIPCYEVNCPKCGKPMQRK
jgi:hypothetical protein